MRVYKDFTFHAAHKDESAPEGDPCGRLHGHSYRLRLGVCAERGDRGMVLHGDIIKEFYHKEIEPYVEHQFLNETLPFNPTMEAVCDWIGSRWRAWLTGAIFNEGRYTVSVCLWETPTMYAEVNA